MRSTLHLRQSISAVLANLGLAWPEKAVIEPPRDPNHGDLACNVAMVLAKANGKTPRDIATALAGALMQHDAMLQSVSVAGPGFLNCTFKPEFWQALVASVLSLKERYGAATASSVRKVLVEYVSANPTGPLHIGHGRGAAAGDSLARILRFAGHEVCTEYYINDAGRQMRLLGFSIWLRLLELAGKPFTLPEDFYRGSYIIDLAQELLQHNPSLPDMPQDEGEAICFAYGVDSILNGIKKDLQDFRVEHEVWFSERSLVTSGAVDRAFAQLAKAGLSYEKDGALWFKTTEFGDDKDRVLRKSGGELTYFASDIAYHHDKFNRGFEQLIDVWGADHHGYIPRMRAAIAAFGKAAESFDVVLIQLVNLLQNGELVSMSTRAGQFETLADVVAEVGVDAARFMFLSRKIDSSLDFDLELVKQRTMDNPVYYVQYAYARVQSIVRKAAEMGITAVQPDAEVLACLDKGEELALVRFVERFEDACNAAAQNLAPHIISHYLMELAGKLHSYYAKYPVLLISEKFTLNDTVEQNQKISAARLLLLQAVGHTLENGLLLLGVNAPKSM